MPKTNQRQPIELLAPARDVETGRQAILHGADAVYIGGPAFGARAAAGNPVEEIASLCRFAHLYGARVYVTFNTILWDDELAEAEAMVWKLYRAGVDALIVQDLSLLRMNLPPIALHASTQTDNCTPEKARLLEAAGFRQIVLARELSIDEIRRVADAITVPVEAFVHGALCVSYSGRCYASQYCFARSANRGKCAQFCRLAFDLVDGNGRVIARDKHLLSLKDMNRTAYLEEMMDAGVRSFKIEGRLKDTAYVKNVTAWYRAHLDAVLERRKDDYVRASQGTSRLTFTPDVNRSFNRGFTQYFLHGREADAVHSFLTPKAVGPVVGQVEEVRGRSFVFRPAPSDPVTLTAGDGLCFVNEEDKLEGFRVNKVEGRLVFPARMPRLKKGMQLHRNLDFAFDKCLSKPTATRTLELDMTLSETPQGYALELCDESGCHITAFWDYAHDEAKKPQRESQVSCLSKLGDTPFKARTVKIETAGERFIPASVLTAWRREACEALVRLRLETYRRDEPGICRDEAVRNLLPASLNYTANVSNRLAREFYTTHGVESIEPAFEVRMPPRGSVIMTCRHCIRRAMGLCLKKTKDGPSSLALRLPDGRVFPLRFDCGRCEMQVTVLS